MPGVEEGTASEEKGCAKGPLWCLSVRQWVESLSDQTGAPF